MKGALTDNHLKFESIDFKLKMEDFNLDLDNFLNEDPVLSKFKIYIKFPLQRHSENIKNVLWTLFFFKLLFVSSEENIRTFKHNPSGIRFSNYKNSWFNPGHAAKQLLKTANKEDIIKMATPHIEKKCSEILLKLCNKILENVDYDEIFPA